MTDTKYASIDRLFSSRPQKAMDKKVRGFAVRSVLVPVLHANRVRGANMGDVSPTDLGAPIGPKLGKDGRPVLKDGRPVLEVRKSIRDFGTMVFESTVTELVSYAGEVQNEQPDAYAASVSEAMEKGTARMNQEGKVISEAVLAYELAQEAAAKAAGVTPIGEGATERQSEKVAA